MKARLTPLILLLFASAPASAQSLNMNASWTRVFYGCDEQRACVRVTVRGLPPVFDSNGAFQHLPVSISYYATFYGQAGLLNQFGFSPGDWGMSDFWGQESRYAHEASFESSSPWEWVYAEGWRPTDVVVGVWYGTDGDDWGWPEDEEVNSGFHTCPRRNLIEPTAPSQLALRATCRKPLNARTRSPCSPNSTAA